MLEQIKELVNSEIGRFAEIYDYILVAKSKNYEEYKISFTKEFKPIIIRAYTDGAIQVKVDEFYNAVSTIDSSCLFLYIALMNAKY